MTSKYYEYFSSGGTYSAKNYIPDLLSPILKNTFCMQYLGDYKWCGPWENDTRKLIQLFFLEGDTAIFEWGYNYHFLPIVKSGKIAYQRTDKTAAAQLRNMPAPFIDFEDWKPFCIPMHAKFEDMLKAEIETVWSRTFPFIKNWYEQTSTLEDMIKEADFQIHHQKYYNFFSPSQQYIRAFLLAASGQYNEAVNSLETSDTFIEAGDELRPKLMKKLTECKDYSL